MYPYLSKYEWLAMADELLRHQAPDVVDLCVRFFLAESRGVSDGRIRALLARRFKHCQLGRTHRDQLVACIARRLTEGNFSEQFKDQLRLALLLDRQAILAAAAAAGCASARVCPAVRAVVLAHAP